MKLEEWFPENIPESIKAHLHPTTRFFIARCHDGYLRIMWACELVLRIPTWHCSISFTREDGQQYTRLPSNNEIRIVAAHLFGIDRARWEEDNTEAENKMIRHLWQDHRYGAKI